tara:strand:+ start:400436 stop:401191 length:756 start_codon:yes stop_codon:yes gene_type:complete
MSKLHNIISLIANGHAFKRHVLGGDDQGDQEFKNKKYGRLLNIRTPHDLAKIIYDAVDNPKNSQAGYDVSANKLVIANTDKNIIIIMDGTCKAGDCGTAFRVRTATHDPSEILDRLKICLDIDSQRIENFDMTEDPRKIKSMVEAFVDRAEFNRKAAQKLNSPEVSKTRDVLKLYEAKLTEQAQAQEQDSLANKFIKFARNNDAENYEVSILDDGSASIAYIQKNGKIEEFVLTPKSLDKVTQKISIPGIS